MLAFRGQTLISVMVALAISCSLLFVIFQFFHSTHLSLNQQFAYLSLQQDTEKLLQLMEKDLRRTGFKGMQKNLVKSNWDLFTQSPQGKALSIGQKLGEMPQSCVVFFYDLDHSGCVGGKNIRGGGGTDNTTSCLKDGHNAIQNVEKELFGYRLNAGVVQTRAEKKSEIDHNCPPELCQSYTAPSRCNQGNWRGLMDNKILTITALQFHFVAGEKAVEIYLKTERPNPPHIYYESRTLVALPNQINQMEKK